MEFLTTIFGDGSTTEILFLVGIGVGVLVLIYGIVSSMSVRNAAAARMDPKKGGSAVSVRSDLLRMADIAPTGFASSFVPADQETRTEVQRALAQAGFKSKNSVMNFYLLRILMGLGLPGAFLALNALGESSIPGIPGFVNQYFTGFTNSKMLQILGVLCAIGYFVPEWWLRSRITERKRRIEEAFPNALDLIQVGVEAGLGFDAAMTRVAQDIYPVAPELAEEMIITQNEIRAGRGRDDALLSMAQRTGVEEINSFASVILQSMQFGTPITDALMTYAEEMRTFRELKAQEKANKLPVQMSAVLSLLMLPAIVMLTLAPVVIRYIRYFAE